MARTDKTDFRYAMTLREIAAELGISFNRVAQIETAALAKLRKALDAEPKTLNPEESD